MDDKGLTEQELRELAQKRRQMFRADLKDQIREKKDAQSKLEQDLQAVTNTGLPIGLDYQNRFDRYKDAHQQALKEQIDQKQADQAADKDVEKRAQESHLKELKAYQDQEKLRFEEAEAARKDAYRREMERSKQIHEEQRLKDLDRKQKELDALALNNRKQQEEEEKQSEAIRRREESHLNDLKAQMNAAADKKVNQSLTKKREEDERKKFKVPAFKPDVKCKLYDCNECHKRYPPSKLNKVKHSLEVAESVEY